MRMAIGFGRVTFGPVPFRDGAAWSVGSVGRNCGLIRAFVAASNPDVSLISFGSLKAVPTKLMPTGSPKMFPFLDKSKCCRAPEVIAARSCAMVASSRSGAGPAARAVPARASAGHGQLKAASVR